MVEEEAYVVITEETYAWVEAERRTGCNACTLSTRCGPGTIAKYLARKSMAIKVANQAGAEVGDRVVIGIPEKILCLSAFILYTVPLLAMFLGAGLGGSLAQYFGGGESLVVLLGLGGLAAGLLGARHVQSESDLEPKILRTISKINRESKLY